MSPMKGIERPDCTTCGNRESSLLCSMTLPEAEHVSNLKSHNIYKKGQVIFYEGNYPHGVFCISKGKVKVHKLGDEGKDQIVRLAKPGSVLGYRALLSGEKYNASATTLEDAVICFIPKDAFMKLLKENNDLSLGAIHLLSTDLKSAEKRITNMAQKPVRERIAEALLMMKECYGFKEDEETIDAILTRREIGNLAGVTTETTIRLLSEFNKDGLVKLDGKKIKLVNLRALVRTANIFD